MVRVRKEDRALADRKIGGGRSAILTGPGVHGLEECSVGLKNVRISKALGLGEPFECGIDASHERGVFKTPDDAAIFFLREIAQITLRLKITERIECHGLTSRK
jgi:hypothetical protein